MKPILFENNTYQLVFNQISSQKFLSVKGDISGFEGEFRNDSYLCKLTPENAKTLRKRLAWLNPQPLGLATSFGFGDRLGLASSGHIASAQNRDIAPIFAQQSVRENQRTGRTPQIVLDDAMWAVFEKDWRAPWGADADHVKEIPDLNPFIDAGYSFYTIDPNEYVDNAAQNDSLSTLKSKMDHLQWGILHTSLEQLLQTYIGHPVLSKTSNQIIQEEQLLRAAAKYGQAIAHIKNISDHLEKHTQKFDLEFSVDETDTPTSVFEHFFIANELRRLEIPFISLAPRFIGKFEKGVDYIGSQEDFEKELEKHAEVMHEIGGYKLSIHTGSDKFSIYPCIAEKTNNLVHVKTAGTSYLEALRVIASVDHSFFREILELSRSRFETDKATYHISGKLDKVPLTADIKDEELIALFEQFDARQVMHVTFGSILDTFSTRFFSTLKSHTNLYEQFLHEHFRKHLDPFCKVEKP